MHNRSVLTIVASLLGLVGGCTDDDVTSAGYYDYYGWPVTDYGYSTDSSLWYDGYYDPYIGYSALTAAAPGDDGGAHARSFPRPLNGLLSAWHVTLRPDCAPTVESTDYDGDGVPASYDATFNCPDQMVNGQTTSLTGTATIIDTDDNDKLSSFAITFANFTVTTTAAGTTRTRTVNGTAKLTPSGGGGFNSDTNLTIAFNFADAGTTPVQGTYTTMGQGSYAPDAPGGDAFASGNVTLSGSGTLARVYQGQSASRMFMRQTTAPLHWNRNCKTQNANSAGYDSGTIVFQDDQGGKVQIQFNGCGNPSVTSG